MASTAEGEDLDSFVGLITGNNTPEARELGARSLLRRGSQVAARRLADILTDSADLAAKHAICRAIVSYGVSQRSTEPNAGGTTMPADDGLPAEILVGPLLGMLGDRGRELDEAIVAALRRFDRSIVIPQMEVLARGATASGAAPASSDSSDDQPGASLIKQEAAIRALGFMGDELHAVGVLVALLGESSGMGGSGPIQPAGRIRIRAAALAALAQATGVQHRSRSSAQAWWEAHRSMAPLQWLRDVNMRRIDQISRLRADKGLLTQRLVGAYRDAYLQTAEGQRPEKLLAFLSDESNAVRRLGIDLINAMITDRKDVGSDIKARLVEMIKEGDSQVQREVAVMVGDLRLAGAVPRLVEALAMEEDDEVRAAQVAALGRLNDDAAVPELVARLDDEAPAVVKEAASALGTLVRKGNADPQVVETVVTAMLTRFSRIPEPRVTDRGVAGDDQVVSPNRAGSVVDATELREHFIEAMDHIGDERFRAVFKSELDTRHSIRIRQAAISGIGSYADAAAAEELRKYVSASEPEIRLAAVQALGRCGRAQEDLDALMGHLDGSQESNATVRERAWEGYQAVAQRLSPQSQLAAAAAFSRPGDLPAQRRRLGLLSALEADEPRYAALSTGERWSLLEAVVDAQFELDRYEEVAKYLEKALQSSQQIATTSAPVSGHRFLAVRLMAALLKAGRDRDAVARLKGCAGGAVVNGSGGAGSTTTVVLDRPGLDEAANVFLAEAKHRLAAAEDAAQFSSLFELTKRASPVISAIAPSVSRQLADVTSEAIAQRDAVVSRLLNAALENPKAEPQFLAFGTAVVLPELLSRLEAQSAATDSTALSEIRLVDLARKLVPAWPGFAAGCPVPEREAALADLRRLQSSARIQPETTPPSAPDQRQP